MKESMMKFYVFIFYFLGIVNAYAHMSIFLKNQSSIPLVSPQGIVILPSRTDVWNIIKTPQVSHQESVKPKPWRGVGGCVILWKDMQPGLKKPLIKVSQKGNKLVCIGKHALLKMEEATPKKRYKAVKAVVPYKPDDELYRLPVSYVPLLPQINELIVYAVPERQQLVHGISSVVMQPTKIMY